MIYYEKDIKDITKYKVVSLRITTIMGLLFGVRYYFLPEVEYSLFILVGPIEIKVSLFDDVPF